MKKMLLFIVTCLTCYNLVSCSLTNYQGNNRSSKLIELEEYSAMTLEGTTSIEVVYDYIEGEFTTYEFIIDNQETIEEIMTEIFKMELKY